MPINSAETAMKVLAETMKNDPEYAWSWHCNLAMLAVDAGACHDKANIRAADFMLSAFKIDTSRNNPIFKPFY